MPEPTNIPISFPVLPETATVKSTGVVMECPVRLGSKADYSDLKALPIEPMVSVRGKNVVAIRTVAKKVGGGSVKEKWATDDYEITISGKLYSGQEGVFPDEWVAWMKGLFEANKSVLIASKLTQGLNITHMAVLDWTLSETPGVAWQSYSIRGVSDDPFFDLVTI